MAGPMIPLSQSLLLASYPKNRAGSALAMWSITTLVAPVVGPLLGGWITDNISWPWIFYINVPVGIAAAFLTWMIFRTRETATARVPVDLVGLGLLVLWVGALQVMLDKGKDLDWFNSPQILVLLGVSIVAFAAFLIWELTEEHPIVDLSLFRRRNFTVATIALLAAYGLFFGNVVLLPLWLQQYMGYTATLAGLVLAPVGVLAIFSPASVGRFADRFDPRVLVDGVLRDLRAGAVHAGAVQHQCDHRHAADSHHHPGCGHGGVLHPAHVHHAFRTAAGADSRRFGTVQLRAHHRRLVRHFDHHHALGPAGDAASRAARRASECRDPVTVTGARDHALRWLRPDQSYQLLNGLVDSQAFMLSANDIFYASGILFLALIGLVWLARPPRGGGGVPAAASGAH